MITEVLLQNTKTANTCSDDDDAVDVAGDDGDAGEEGDEIYIYYDEVSVCVCVCHVFG